MGNEFRRRPQARQTRRLTSDDVVADVASLPAADRGRSSRACMKESKLIADADVLLGDGDGGGTNDLPGAARSFSRLDLRPFLLCRCRSMIISMLSIALLGSAPSDCSVLTGVLGGDISRLELVLAAETERVREKEELAERDSWCKSEPDLDL